MSREPANIHFNNTYQSSSEVNCRYSIPNSVLWYLTYRCNLKCQHCLVGNMAPCEEMGIRRIENLLIELRRLGVSSIDFSGGEPLLRTDLLEIVGKASDLNLGVTLSTNGLLITDKLLQKLKDLNVICFQISLDGIGRTHDSFRGVKGAYKRAVAAFKATTSMGMYTTMSTTITRHNLNEIGQMLDLAVSLGVSSFKLNSFMPLGRGAKNKKQLQVPKEKLRLLAQQISEKEKEYENLIDMQLSALSPWLLKPEPVHPSGEEQAPCLLQCPAGYSMLVIAPDGSVFPCPYLTDFNLGNILEKSLTEIWNNNNGILGKFRKLRQENISGKCNDCGYVPTLCNGGCRAAAYLEYGDFYGEDPLCWKPVSQKRVRA